MCARCELVEQQALSSFGHAMADILNGNKEECIKKLLSMGTHADMLNSIICTDGGNQKVALRLLALWNPIEGIEIGDNDGGLGNSPDGTE